MIHRNLGFLFSAGLLAVAASCGPSADTVKSTTESTTQSAEGTVQTSTETKQVGTTLEATSETKVDTSSGTVQSKTTTTVGTVTVFTPGQKLEVMTGEKTIHGFDLEEKDVVYSVDPAVAVGSRVTVTEETGDNKVRRITVRLGS